MIDKSYKQWYEAGKKKPRKGFWWGGSPQDYDTPSPSPSYSGDYEGEAYGTTPAASYSDPSPAPSPSSDDNWDQSPVYNQPAPAPVTYDDSEDDDDDGSFDVSVGAEEYLNEFGGNAIKSPFQDGHYIYTVIAGGGSGSSSYSPILYVADLENPNNFKKKLQP